MLIGYRDFNVTEMRAAGHDQRHVRGALECASGGDAGKRNIHARRADKSDCRFQACFEECVRSVADFPTKS